MSQEKPRISKETAADIAFAYCEIEAAEMLLKDMAVAKNNREPPNFRDAFGRQHTSLQLGVPSGRSGHTLFRVQPDLAEIIIKAHVDQMRAKIDALTALALQEAGVGR